MQGRGARLHAAEEGNVECCLTRCASAVCYEARRDGVSRHVLVGHAEILGDIKSLFNLSRVGLIVFEIRTWMQCHNLWFRIACAPTAARTVSLPPRETASRRSDHCWQRLFGSASSRRRGRVALPTARPTPLDASPSSASRASALAQSCASACPVVRSRHARLSTLRSIPSARTTCRCSDLQSSAARPAIIADSGPN